MIAAALADQLEQFAKAHPMKPEGPVEGRVLLVDGDGLAYFCAGNDDTDPGQARTNLISKVQAAMRAAGADTARILVTDQSSHKGHRYAIARARPYQGQRSGGRRPKNWSYLRGILESDALPFPTDATVTAEADDLFGRYVTEVGPDRAVIYSQDKDMRMLPGLHLNWDTHVLVPVPEGTFELTYDDKVYGEKWFWLQLLQGDPADNIPGLPGWYLPGDIKPRLMGPKTAETRLADAKDRNGAWYTVLTHYESFYGQRAKVEIAEQGALLWMRRDPASSWFDVFRAGNPLEHCQDSVFELIERIG